MKHHTSYSLTSFNTFGIQAKAESFYQIDSIYSLKDLCHKTADPVIIGGGSNILIMEDIKRDVWKYNVKGREIIKEHEDHCLVEFQAGENWHESVIWATKNNLGGIENLALIPGNIGAAPMQNIGAYGVELKDVIHTVHAVEISSGLSVSFFNDECKFAYRSSIFKTDLKNKLVITSIVLKLTKEGFHKINTEYGAISNELKEANITEPTITDIAAAVSKIRTSKLPDPKLIGNAGSFFKNPVITKAHYEKLKTKFPNIVSYPAPDNQIKVPAGWLIDKAGWKGKRIGNVSTYKHQALVIINEGNASGKEIFQYSEHIIESIDSTYGILLEREVNVIR